MCTRKPTNLLLRSARRCWPDNGRRILGKKIILDGAVTRIVGVLPVNFETPDLLPADILVPQKLPQRPHTQNYQVTVIGRLRPGQTTASAPAILSGPFERFRLDFGQRVGSNFAQSMKLHIEPLRDQQIRQYRLALCVLLGGVSWKAAKIFRRDGTAHRCK